MDGVQMDAKKQLLADKTTIPETVDEAWEMFENRLYARDKAVSDSWKDEIDALLTFSGLFAAVLSVFIVELYPLLQPPSTSSDPTSQALLHLIGILSNGSLPPDLTSPSVASMPSNAIVCINSLMFSSLITVLSSALVGIIIKQWLNFFISTRAGNAERRAYIHCLRWDEGLRKWHVHNIISVISVLLQLSVALFMAGIIVLLWTLNRTVATVATSFASTLGAFWIWSTIAPSISPECPYKSPQSLAFHWLTHRYGQFYALVKNIISHIQRSQAQESSDSFENHDHLSQKPPRSWAALEQFAMNPSLHQGNSQHSESLMWIKDNIFACANSLLMDGDLLSHVIPLCVVQPLATPKIEHETGDTTTNIVASQGVTQMSESENKRMSVEASRLRSSKEAAISSLKRLQPLFQEEAQATDTLRDALASTAVMLIKSVPTLLVQELYSKQSQLPAWDTIPHLCAGGQSHMVPILHCLATLLTQVQDLLAHVAPHIKPGASGDQSSPEYYGYVRRLIDTGLPNLDPIQLVHMTDLIICATSSAKERTTNIENMLQETLSNLVEMFVSKLIGYGNCWRIWSQDPLQLVTCGTSCKDEVGKDVQYIAKVVVHISQKILHADGPSRGLTPIWGKQQYNASYLAMFFVTCIPQNERSKSLLITRRHLTCMSTQMKFYHDYFSQDAEPYNNSKHSAGPLIRAYDILESDLRWCAESI